MVALRRVMTSVADRSSRKGLWPVYAFGGFIVAGFVLAALGAGTCL